MKPAGSSKVGFSVFVFPEEEDMFTHCMSEVVMKLPLPTKGIEREENLSNFKSNKLSDFMID